MIHLKRHLNRVLRAVKDCFVKLYIRHRGREGKLRQAIRKAEKLHEKTGRRYRVFFFGYRYRVWTRGDVRRNQKSGLFRPGLKSGDDFDTICFFDTNNPGDHVH